jgi:hypothetical protein
MHSFTYGSRSTLNYNAPLCILAVHYRRLTGQLQAEVSSALLLYMNQKGRTWWSGAYRNWRSCSVLTVWTSERTCKWSSFLLVPVYIALSHCTTSSTWWGQWWWDLVLYQIRTVKYAIAMMVVCMLSIKLMSDDMAELTFQIDLFSFFACFSNLEAVDNVSFFLKNL